MGLERVTISSRLSLTPIGRSHVHPGERWPVDHLGPYPDQAAQWTQARDPAQRRESTVPILGRRADALQIAHGHRWLTLLEIGRRKIVAGACKEGEAPDIVAAVLDDTLPPDLTLFDLAINLPLRWEKQRGNQVL